MQEFVDLYTEWLLSSSIHQKFKAFKQGFDLVMSQSCLADLVIAEELELIICGSTVSGSSGSGSIDLPFAAGLYCRSGISMPWRRVPDMMASVLSNLS